MLGAGRRAEPIFVQGLSFQAGLFYVPVRRYILRIETKSSKGGSVWICGINSRWRLTKVCIETTAGALACNEMSHTGLKWFRTSISGEPFEPHAWKLESKGDDPFLGSCIIIGASSITPPCKTPCPVCVSKVRGNRLGDEEIRDDIIQV